MKQTPTPDVVVELSEILQSLRALFDILDTEEVSDSGNVFRPTSIMTCRTEHLLILEPVLGTLRAAAGVSQGPEPTEPVRVKPPILEST